MILDELIAQVRTTLSQSGIGDSARNGRLIIQDLGGFSPTQMITDGKDTVAHDVCSIIFQAMERIIKGESVYRVLGHREFYGLDLTMSQATLEPRPESELLVDTILPYATRLETRAQAPKILDLGTGTGALALALLSQIPTATATGVDISSQALQTACQNAKKHGLDQRFTPILSNWLENINHKFDIVISNPPYIATAQVDQLETIVRNYDPRISLDGGIKGTNAYETISANIAPFLVDDGIIGVEIGYNQKQIVSEIFKENGFTAVQSVCDLGGKDRVLVFTKTAE